MNEVTHIWKKGRGGISGRGGNGGVGEDSGRCRGRGGFVGKIVDRLGLVNY